MQTHNRESHNNRPWVLYNAAMSLDGKIATVGGDTQFSDHIDWQEVHSIRNQVDAIMVGIGTVLADDPRLTIQTNDSTSSLTISQSLSQPLAQPSSQPPSFPTRIVVDGRLQIPADARVITFKSDQYPTLVVTTSQADQDKILTLEAKGVEVLVLPGTNHVPLGEMMRELYDRGIHIILFEGGGTLAWGLLEAGLIDEIRLFIAPHLVGGANAKGLIMGEGFSHVFLSPEFTLTQIHSRDSYVILRYIKKEKSSE